MFMFGAQLLYEAIEFPMAVSMQRKTVGTRIITPSSGMMPGLENSNDLSSNIKAEK